MGRRWQASFGAAFFFFFLVFGQAFFLPFFYFFGRLRSLCNLTKSVLQAGPGADRPGLVHYVSLPSGPEARAPGPGSRGPAKPPGDATFRSQLRGRAHADRTPHPALTRSLLPPHPIPLTRAPRSRSAHPAARVHARFPPPRAPRTPTRPRPRTPRE